MEFARWLDSKNILFCASAGGMRSSAKTGAKMKKMGYKKGFPDIFIYRASRGCYGLSIELKVKGGTKSFEQKSWKACLITNGYQALIMPTTLNVEDGLEWLKEAVNQYLG